MKPVRFLASARNDIRREKAYYRRIDPGLAKRFQIDVETATAKAANQPLAMQVIESGVRRWPLDKFPHGILYRNESELILVLAVFHPKQSPEQWRKRSQAY